MFSRYLGDGADPDPWTIYPDVDDCCGESSPPDPRNDDKTFSCSRKSDHSVGLHVARNGFSKVVATWEDSDEGKQGPDEYLNPDGTPEKIEVVDDPRPYGEMNKKGPVHFRIGDVVLLRKEARYSKGDPGKTHPLAGKPQIVTGVVPPIDGRIIAGADGEGMITLVDQKTKKVGGSHRAHYFDLVSRAATKEPKAEKGQNMAQSKDDKQKERAEIAYAEEVTYRVDGGKEIRVEDEDEAILWLQRRKEEREKEVQFVENIEGFPSDGMIALARVLRREYGFTRFDSPSPFGTPIVLSIPVGPHGEMMDAPWGKFTIPGLSGFVQTSINKDKRGQPIFQLVAKIKNKDKDKVKNLAHLVRKDLLTNSIYKGEAIKVEFPDFRKVQYDPTIHVPTFLDTDGFTREKLIFSAEVQNAIETSIFTPIEFADRVRQETGKLKRGVLLGGKPGTGKSLTANVTAKMCEDHGWTFIYLASTGDFAQAMDFAKLYQPAVIFAEDLDSIVNTYSEDSENRDEGTMAVLNTLDGIDSKTSDILVVFTTNYPEKLPEAMIRPGRLDAVITVLPPDKEAVERLVRYYAGNRLGADEDLNIVSRELAGEIPAVIREVVDRSKLVAIRHTPKNAILHITSQDLIVAKDSMKSHLRMLNEKRQPPPGEIEKAANVVMTHVMSAMKQASQPQRDEYGNRNHLYPPEDSGIVKRTQAALPFPKMD